MIGWYSCAVAQNNQYMSGMYWYVFCIVHFYHHIIYMQSVRLILHFRTIKAPPEAGGDIGCRRLVYRCG